ncbi:L,D-transpeptidase [Dietzia sp. 111N12-1]|uniref:L,D-transpeptidase n=1 Tax=Dietzia sp. 111N12-1 TaxID=1785156 RepID=UPI00082E9994|nr:L,D-transpeptidase [Dietzia sp. 111N12-1]
MDTLLSRAGAVVAAALIAVGGAAPVASAQLPVALPAEVQQVVDQAQAGSAQAEEQVRTSVGGSLAAAGITPPPGLAPSQARSPQPAPPPPPPPDPTPQSPCPRTAAACVDLDGNRTWLQSGERLSYGPVRMSHGMAGWETPRGTYQVTRKVRHEVSRLFDNAPMPYAVYFVGGIAFHEGDPTVESHGCIRLDQPAAATFFDRLEVGDTVVVF